MRRIFDTTAKPYYRCLSCLEFRNECAGIPTRDMDLKEWCEFIRDVMNEKRLTIAYVAEAAGVSEKLIERIRAINTDQDIMRANARRVEIVVLGSVTKHICDMDPLIGKATEKIERLEAENAILRESLEYLKAEDKRKAKVIDKLLGE
jgi:hypothetical protein